MVLQLTVVAHPFGGCCRNGVVTIRLPGDEASDILNFVLKDDATNTWYDNMGKNFAVDLKLRAPAAPAPGVAKAPKVPDQLPRALCDTWAWIKWDHAGALLPSICWACGQSGRVFGLRTPLEPRSCSSSPMRT